MGTRAIGRVGMTILVSALALSGLGMSATFYRCPMQAEITASPCCPDIAVEPSPVDTASPPPCCQALQVEIAPGSRDSVRPQTEAGPVKLVAVTTPPIEEIAPAPVLRARQIRTAPTHGPPPLAPTIRLLI